MDMGWNPGKTPIDFSRVKISPQGEEGVDGLNFTWKWGFASILVLQETSSSSPKDILSLMPIASKLLPKVSSYLCQHGSFRHYVARASFIEGAPALPLLATPQHKRMLKTVSNATHYHMPMGLWGHDTADDTHPLWSFPFMIPMKPKIPGGGFWWVNGRGALMTLRLDYSLA